LTHVCVVPAEAENRIGSGEQSWKTIKACTRAGGACVRGRHSPARPCGSKTIPFHMPHLRHPDTLGAGASPTGASRGCAAAGTRRRPCRPSCRIGARSARVVAAAVGHLHWRAAAQPRAAGRRARAEPAWSRLLGWSPQLWARGVEPLAECAAGSRPSRVYVFGPWARCQAALCGWPVAEARCGDAPHRGVPAALQRLPSRDGRGGADHGQLPRAPAHSPCAVSRFAVGG
jgi:hypothetical protein